MKPLQQAVILCGGRGTRLAPVIGDLPKILAKVGGRELLGHLLEDLSAAGTREVLLLAGHGGEQVAEAAGRLCPGGLAVHAVVEPAPRGTAGALLGVSDRLAERFLLIYGDVFASLDWKLLAAAAERDGGLATLVVHRSSHPQDSDLVVLDDADRLIGWIDRDPSRRSGVAAPGALLGNSGVMVLHRDVLHYIPRSRPSDLTAEVLPRRVSAREPIFGYRTCEYLLDLGTPDRLATVDRHLREGRTRLRAELVLLDRDGVLNEEVGNLHHPEQLRLIPGAAAGLRRLNQAGIRAVVVTNQPVVARGLCSLETLERIHARLGDLLAREEAHLDGLHFCPHHPETQHDQGHAALRGPCSCRKPSPGMVEAALGEHPVEASRAVVVGDRTQDLQLALNAGLPGIALQTGRGCRDGRYPARPVWCFTDLTAVAAWLSGESTAAPALELTNQPPGGRLK